MIMIDTRRDDNNHLLSNKREWNNCFVKKEQGQPEDNLMVAISQALYYYGTYTIAAKLVKSIELHYTMIQF